MMKSIMCFMLSYNLQVKQWATTLDKRSLKFKTQINKKDC